MTYYFGSPDARQNPGAGISTSVNWESAAGTLLSNASKDETVTKGSTVYKVGETLEVSVTTLANGAEVPSYNCTTAFQFTDKVDTYYTYANNSLSWTCVSVPVITWCTHLLLFWLNLLPWTFIFVQFTMACICHCHKSINYTTITTTPSPPSPPPPPTTTTTTTTTTAMTTTALDFV